MTVQNIIGNVTQSKNAYGATVNSQSYALENSLTNQRVTQDKKSVQTNENAFTLSKASSNELLDRFNLSKTNNSSLKLRGSPSTKNIEKNLPTPKFPLRTENPKNILKAYHPSWVKESEETRKARFINIQI